MFRTALTLALLLPFIAFHTETASAAANEMERPNRGDAAKTARVLRVERLDTGVDADHPDLDAHGDSRLDAVEDLAPGEIAASPFQALGAVVATDKPAATRSPGQTSGQAVSASEPEQSGDRRTLDVLTQADLAHPGTIYGDTQRNDAEGFSLLHSREEIAAVEDAVADFSASMRFASRFTRSTPQVGRIMELARPHGAPGWRLFQTQYFPGTRSLFGKKHEAILRMGYYQENPAVPFRGNVLYLEGLADSMMNHDNLFAGLSNAGYRVIAFDYMGQGGSSGKMNWTRLQDAMHPGRQIATIGHLAWRLFSNKASDRKIVLGWSTGGLAAYEMAHLEEADAVILIAPAINGVKISRANLVVTMKDLTHADYSKERDFHVDPIKPRFPASVPLFTLNLLRTAWESGFWKISERVKGLAILSGDSDPLVSSHRTLRALARNAPHFETHQFADSAHEVHNEVASIRDAATRLILDFLARLN